MKDAAHHRKYTQKKVLQSVRKENGREGDFFESTPQKDIQEAAKDYQDKKY